MAATSDEIYIRHDGAVARITLTRPGALNALTLDMVSAISAELDAIRDAATADLVVVDGQGGKAFCAGGDIAKLYETGRAGDFAYGRTFFAEEYRMNARVAGCRVPYVALMDGIVMGGGVGISGHGTHRVVTERSMIAMPECGIGLVPDVGSNCLLSRAPGHLGEFLALTGWRMTAADALHAGFADLCVASEDLGGLKEALVESVDTAVLDDFRRDPGEAPLAEHAQCIDRHFSRPTALECLQSLEADGSEFAAKAAAMIRRGCPLSVACSFEIVRRARKIRRIEDCLALEYRFTYRCMSEGEFLEGVRAQIIEKDRDPRWRTARLEDIESQAVEAMLAPLGADELEFAREKTA